MAVPYARLHALPATQAHIQSIWSHCAVLIKPFSSEAALLAFFSRPRGESPNPRRRAVKISRRRRQSATARQELEPLRRFPSLPVAPRRAVVRSPEPPGAHVDYLCARHGATVHRCLQSVSGLASSPAPPVQKFCVSWFFISWMVTPAFLFLTSLLWGFIELARGVWQAFCSWSPKSQWRSARVLALFIWAFFLGQCCLDSTDRIDIYCGFLVHF
jgi:hypothetical protein